MGFLRRLLFGRKPQTVSPFQKQSRLWFVLLGRPIYVSQAEMDAKFFQACNKAFTCKEKVLFANFYPPPTEKELHCQHCGYFVFHHRKCFTWITLEQRAKYADLSERSMAQACGYIHLQGDAIRLEQRIIK
jgi:hypothetical protein